MYAKLVRHVDGSLVLADGGRHEVVPREHVMIESPRFHYRKYLGSSVRVIMEEHGLEGEVLACDGLSSSLRGFELIHLVAIALDGEHLGSFIAPDCQLYIMNNAGKTIYSVCCLIQAQS